MHGTATSTLSLRGSNTSSATPSIILHDWNIPALNEVNRNLLEWSIIVCSSLLNVPPTYMLGLFHSQAFLLRNSSSAPPLLVFLPRHFNPLTDLSWTQLLSHIEQWLVALPSGPAHHLWSWGIDLFWVAYVANSPSFPLGNPWPTWNHVIPFRSLFLDYWLQSYRSYQNDNPALLHLRVRLRMWAIIHRLYAIALVTILSN